MKPTATPAPRLTAGCIWRSFQSSGKRRLLLTGRSEDKAALLAHAHDNKCVLDSLDRDESGRLTIGGQPVDDVLGMSVPSEAKTASVYNLSGQRVLQERVSGTECEVSVASLPAGYYIVSVETTDGTQYRAKFVKR